MILLKMMYLFINKIKIMMVLIVHFLHQKYNLVKYQHKHIQNHHYNINQMIQIYIIVLIMLLILKMDQNLL